MAFQAILVERAHKQMAIGVNIKGHLIAGNPFVWELPDEMAGDATSKIPTEL